MITSCCSGSLSGMYPYATSYGYSSFVSPFASYRTPTMKFSCCGYNGSDF